MQIVNVNDVINYLSEYGMIFVFLIVFLEYLNLPGFPAGVIMPVAGFWSRGSGNNFFDALVVSVMAGIIASWVLYGIGWYGGEVLFEKYTKKFPKQKEFIEEKLEYLKEKGCIGVFISKLIPMVRTLISIPAGVIKLNFIKYTIYSTLGIVIWNGAFMGAGYIVGEKILNFIV